MRSISSAAIVAALLLSACGKQAPPPRPAPQVGVITVQMQPVTLTTELPGRTLPFESSEVRPQVDGIITKRLFQEGETVHAGQVLYQIDPAPYAAAAANARAARSMTRSARNPSTAASIQRRLTCACTASSNESIGNRARAARKRPISAACCAS